jgi:hypothetical protein
MDLASKIAIQLKELANEDDQLGRGVFELFYVANGPTPSSFVIVAKESADGPLKAFNITVTEEQR